MVQFIPAKDDWANAFRNIGSGLTEGYINRSDENAVKKSLMDLGQNPSARQILDALINTKTHSPQAKQQALSNYLGVEQFEELKRKASAQEQLDRSNSIIEADDLKKKRDLEKGNARALIEQSSLSDEQKMKLQEEIENDRLNFEGAKEITKIKKDETSDKEKEGIKAKKAGIQTIERMREIGRKNNLGRGSNFLKVFGGETAKDFGEYEQLGKSLIQLSTNIPIRNRQEFEVLAHKLYDPSLPDMEREGILSALESILKNNISEENPQESKSRPPLSSFMR